MFRSHIIGGELIAINRAQILTPSCYWEFNRKTQKHLLDLGFETKISSVAVALRTTRLTRQLINYIIFFWNAKNQGILLFRVYLDDVCKSTLFDERITYNFLKWLSSYYVYCFSNNNSTVFLVWAIVVIEIIWGWKPGSGFKSSYLRRSGRMFTAVGVRNNPPISRRFRLKKKKKELKWGVFSSRKVIQIYYNVSRKRISKKSINKQNGDQYYKKSFFWHK